MPVGDAFLGRVVDPLGQPIDGLGDIAVRRPARSNCRPRNVVQRKSVHEPLQTGLKAVDAMTPIGRGQRQLIIGDRQTGKTTVAVDTIINQKQFWDSATRQAGSLHLRRHRPEGLDHRLRARARSGRRRDGVHHHRRPRLRPRRLQVPRPTPARPSASTGCTGASTS